MQYALADLVMPSEITVMSIKLSSCEYALRKEDRILFNKVFNEYQQKEEGYSKAFKAKGEYSSTESLFMALIFQQQKMISN